MSKFILVLNGSSCSGKTTIAKLLLDKIPDSFRVSGDRIKWLISNYSKIYRQSVYKLSLALAEAALVEGFSLITDGSGYFYEGNEDKYKNLALKYQARLIAVNIEAPFETILERFNKRVLSAKIEGNKISNTDPKRLKEIYDTYLENKDEQAPIFDSSLLSAEEICAEILKLIN